ncbi:MAG: hypothetical protein ACI8W8_003197 [Rhodothermales bacterium]|jgi:hypothetical protein
MSDKPWHLNRRTVLKGMGVTCLLPFFEAMAQDTARASVPRRLLNLYVGNGVSLPTQKMAELREDWHWFPHKAGPDYTMTKVLEPLAPKRDQFTILGGLSHPKSRDLLGHTAGDSWLTGGNAGTEYKNSISIDQVVADHYKNETRYSYMNLSTDGGTGYRGRTTTLAFDRNGRPIPAESNVRRIFERMFQIDNRDLQARKIELQKKRRVVDLILEDSKRLKKNLGQRDQQKLDEYMGTLRDLEARIERLEAWQGIPMKAFDASHLDLSVTLKSPKEFIRSICDLMVLAFETDICRVANYQLVREDNLGLGTKFATMLFGFDDHHRMSHGKSEKNYKDWATYDQFLIQQLDYLLERLAAATDEHGRLLDNTLVFYGGSNSTYHNARNYPLILAGGKNMGLKHGRYMKFDEDKRILSDLFVSMLNALEVPAESFADSKGSLDEIFRA